jgi:hypothetical protein
MSQHQIQKTIEAEISHLNQVIDLKVIRGLSYKSEAKRHRFLLSQLSSLKARRSGGWLAKSFSLVSSFVL